MPSVRVRMYRQGLGDCFLLTFDPDGKPAHMLIDCGSLGSVTTKVQMADVVADIRKATGNHLHVLVATHEHRDHLSGFRDHRAVFEKMKIDHVWLAWTENPDDALARQLAKNTADIGAAIAEACRQFSKSADKENLALGGEIDDVCAFYYEPSALGAAKLATTVNEAMHFVRTGVRAKTRYLDPGDLVDDRRLFPGFRFYVLGPPRSEEKIKRAGGHGGDDLYALRMALSADCSSSRARPFDVRFSTDPAKDYAGQLPPAYTDPKDDWRRIDEDWLHDVSELAIQYDNCVNNTSLVLAIERIADGRVLLFPGDAQLGSWESWHDDNVRWTVSDPGGPEKTLVARDLLERTVFYKVGHHASHNGTTNKSGLAHMKRENELIAFIPVDRQVALKRSPAGSWRMPARALLRHLLEHCQGRVARSDTGWVSDAATAANKTIEQEFESLVTPDEWQTWSQKQKNAPVTVTPLYIDYVLKSA